jgi:hypothetical protein
MHLGTGTAAFRLPVVKTFLIDGSQWETDVDT